jgi:hypothetical protein
LLSRHLTLTIVQISYSMNMRGAVDTFEIFFFIWLRGHFDASLCVSRHSEQRSRVYLVKQYNYKRRLTLLIVISFIVESPCVH